MTKTNKMQIVKNNQSPFGLYIHIPFCPYKCHYCDFLTFAHADSLIDRYMLYLEKEIKLYKGQNLILDSIFIGGGTPSYLDGKYIERLMDQVQKTFVILEGAEISIEMNPNTLNEERIRSYLNSGINRFSLGVQTFDDQILKILGRSHNKDIVFNEVQMLKDLGVKNLSLDMMLGNPNQDIDILKNDLDAIENLDIQHISYYTLILEEKTLFAHWLREGKIDLFDDDLERLMFDEVKKRLKKMGFEHYEVSNFAKASFESVHNKKYWQQSPYLAVGLGASAQFDAKRRRNVTKFKDYFALLDEGKLPIGQLDELSQEDLEKEFIIMAMRLKKGFSIELINKKFDINFLEKYQTIIKKHTDFGAVQIQDGRFSFTDYGMDIANQFYIDIL